MKLLKPFICQRTSLFDNERLSKVIAVTAKWISKLRRVYVYCNATNMRQVYLRMEIDEKLHLQIRNQFPSQ